MVDSTITFEVLFKPVEGQGEQKPDRMEAMKKEREKEKRDSETIIEKKPKTQAAKQEDKVQFAEFWDRVKKEQRKENKIRDRELEKQRRAAAKKTARRNARLGAIASSTPGVIANPAAFAGSAALGAISRVIPPAMIALIAYEVFKIVRDQYFGPGGPGDVRLKILIGDQVQVFMNRQERADLQLGKKVIRTSTLGTLRGAQVASKTGGSLHAVARGERIELDMDDYASRGDP